MTLQLPTLAQALCDQHEATLLRQAETIRDWHRGRERDDQAAIHVRQALREQNMGRISQATQSLIYSILSFAMPADHSFVDESTPLAELEREAEIEAAFFEQLDRQSCPECGDGLCPVDDSLPYPKSNEDYLSH